MLSFLKSFLKWIFSSFVAILLFSYLLKAGKFFLNGTDVSDALLWFRIFVEKWTQFKDFFLAFGFGWVVSAFVSFMVFLLWIDDLNKLENLQEKIRNSEDKLKKLGNEKNKLENEISALQKKKESYQSALEGLSQEIRNLSERKNSLLSSIRSLEERKENLASYLEEEFQKGYEAGREKGYQSVITELRSLRIQKSALLRVFDGNKELKTLFKKITGKTVRQYLNEVKKKAKSSGGKS
jgi:vacuolar-type H+-ATPase subunit I/STV1